MREKVGVDRLHLSIEPEKKIVYRYGILYLIQHYISTKATFFFIFYYIIKEHVIEWFKNILKGKKE